MRKIEINTFITVMAFDNANDFFVKVKGEDAIAITDKGNIIDAINNHKSYLSMIDESFIGKNTIEKNKDKLLSVVNTFNPNEKWIIVRYTIPKVDYIYDNRPRIVGWSYKS